MAETAPEDGWSSERWRVFVSSTSAGLQDLRAAAREVIENSLYE